ncbi:hypothetical protein AcW2_006962 [Taiwanofungus camphoratus]|nr:hypothetical protein AcW2_006962 [Antrodia cinnamomea]
MLGKLPSSRFTTIYDSLPADAQQALVEKHLIPLLNLVEKGRSKKVLTYAKRLQKRHAGIPVLDLRAKAIEVNALLDELRRDAKRAFVKERSNKGELLNETIDSLTDWLNEIWSVVYEHNVDFMHAHKCLLFVADTLDRIGNGWSGCRCVFANMYVSVALKRKSGKRIKSFEIHGAHNVEEVLHFIWRDLFLSLLATGSEHHISKIPEMLEEIEDLLGWSALERVLYGGRKCPHGVHDDEDDDEEENFDSDFEIEDVDNESFFDETDDGSHYGRHWSYRVSSQMWQLREHIQTAMMSVFKLRPSLRLYSALCAVSIDPRFTEVQLMKHLDAVATSCPETFSAALDIHAFEGNTEAIVALLNSHAHLLRSRDAPALQTAVLTIARNPFFQQRGLRIIEKEMLDTAHAVHAALLVSFSQLEQPANKGELEQIIKLRHGAAGRQDRVESWVDAVSTPGMNAPNPMAFAAMMMGLPLVPGMDASEDADPLGYLDLDPHDPDLEDLREEFRPRLKQRFEGWSNVAIKTKGGQTVLLKVYKELIEIMPFLRANDIVEEMVGRLADKPSKHHVCDGLDALLAFAKVQKRKVAQTRTEVKRRKGLPVTAGQPSSISQPSALTISGGFAEFFDPPHPTADTSRSGIGGMEDID